MIHPTADTEIRLHQAEAIVEAAGADDITSLRLVGAPHYLQGHRVAAAKLMVQWLADRY